MAYSKRAIEGIEGIDPQSELEAVIKDLRRIEQEVASGSYERDSDWIRAQEVRLKAVNSRAKVLTDMMDRVVPRARTVEVSVQEPEQMSLDFVMGDEVSQDLGEIMQAVKHQYPVQ